MIGWQGGWRTLSAVNKMGVPHILVTIKGWPPADLHLSKFQSMRAL